MLYFDFDHILIGDTVEFTLRYYVDAIFNQSLTDTETVEYWNMRNDVVDAVSIPIFEIY